MIQPGDELNVVLINWVSNPFRGDKFEESWAPAAEAATKYGARAWAFLRSKDDPLQFSQFAVFDKKMDFERYWFSEEIAEARVKASGLYQVPILPIWFKSISFGVVADTIAGVDQIEEIDQSENASTEAA